MRRIRKAALWALAVLLLLPVLVAGGVWGGLNTSWGQGRAAALVESLTGGQVALQGLSGRFPDALRLRRVEIRDTEGVWLTADDVALDWSPTKLLRRHASVQRLQAARVAVARTPVSAPPGPDPAQPAAPLQLPVTVGADRIHVNRIELAQPVAGVAAVLSLDGQADVQSLQSGSARLALQRLDGEGRYTLDAALAPGTIRAALDATEPDNGLVATLGSLPGLGPLALQGRLDGPRDAAATNLTLSAGPLRAAVQGTLDLVNNAADVDVTGTAPAMSPRPDLSWGGISLQARVRGPFTAPDATGQLRVDSLAAAGAAVRRLVADIEGNAGRGAEASAGRGAEAPAGRVGLRASAEGVRIPGPNPGLLEAAPVQLSADARLDGPARPVAFTLSHPLLQAKGRALTGGALSVQADVTAPDLQPLAALGGVDLQGRTALHVEAGVAGNATLKLDGTVSVTGGLAPVPALVGQDAALGLTASLAGQDVTVTRLDFAGRALRLGATGSFKGGVLDVAYKLGLPDLSVLAPTVTGGIEAEGTAKGAADNLAVTADARGEVGAPGVPRGPVRVQAQLAGLPGAPAGTVTAGGTLAGAPVSLALRARRGDDGLHATIEHADWRSLHAEGQWALPPGATTPTGRVSVRAGRLDDLQPFVGQALTGAVTADLQLDPAAAHLKLQARNAGVPGSRVGALALDARVTDLLGRPKVAAQLQADGIDAAGVAGSAKLDVTGPQDALAVRTTANVRVSGTDAAITGAATVNATTKTVALSALQVAGRGETLRLLAPAQIRLADGVAVDRLRLGVRQAVLEVAGRLSPTLDATATLRTPADIATLASPEFAADGTITAEARLTGTPAAPNGAVKLTATGLRARTGPARGLPAASVNATVQLGDGAARLDARLAAGNAAQLTITGRAPLGGPTSGAGGGALDLRAQGSVDLLLLDPILTPGGRRARGRVQLDAGVAGTPAAPRVTGTATLAGGEIQDFGQGVRITALAASLRADGDTVRIVSLAGRAGAGSITASGTVGVGAPGLPVDLAVQLRNASPLASDRLTAVLDGDITVRGPAAGGLQVGGRVGIRRADITIPERLPATIAVLDVRRPAAGAAGRPGAGAAGQPGAGAAGRPGQKPPAPPAPSAPIGLDMVVDAPRAIFVRGRGVDAELGGQLRVRGTSAAPEVSGGFELRRGAVSVAGTTLTFTRGKVGFDGTGVTGKLDPTLDFSADSTAGNVVATLAITGYASAPKISLRSVPELPQDEVLAYLLFKRSAKELGPFQLAEIAAAVASLTGVGGNVANPLESVRRGLGLDRLSVGGGASGNAPTVEAGRYVGNGVYVGAKQGTTGGQTQATVQIDITKGLKLESDVGTGAGGNSVGLTYQFEY